MPAKPSATVAGAGVFGLSCALALAEAGFAVEVRDPAPFAANASGVAAGMLSPALEAALDASAADHLELLWAARDLWSDFADRHGLVLSGGTLAAGEPGWLEALAVRLVTLGFGVEPAEAAALPDLAPGLQVIGVPGELRLDAPAALHALRGRAVDLGVTFRAEAVGAAPEGLLVVATGAAAGLESLAPELADLAPIKGHILHAPVPLDRVVRGDGVYAAPADGGLLLGASMEVGRGDLDVDAAVVAALRERGAALFPDLAEAPMAARVGVRAATPDGAPMVGPSLVGDTILAVGARRNGWLLAPLVAEMTAAYATGRDPGPFAAALYPGRAFEAWLTYGEA